MGHVAILVEDAEANQLPLVGHGPTLDEFQASENPYITGVGEVDHRQVPEFRSEMDAEFEPFLRQVSHYVAPAGVHPSPARSFDTKPQVNLQ